MTAAKSNVSRIPADAPDPQDRKPKKTPARKASAKARQAEATDGFVFIEACGMTLKIPVGEKVPLDAVLVFMGDKDTLDDLGIKPQDSDLAGTRLMLGEEQWAEFRKRKPTVGDFNAVGTKLQELAGN